MEVDLGGAESLGLMIRGGVEYGLGIFITGVDDGSSAHKAGLQVSFIIVTNVDNLDVFHYLRGQDVLILLIINYYLRRYIPFFITFVSSEL